MKVLCMESPVAWAIVAALYGGTFPEVLNECTVKATRRCKCGKHDVYDLEEFSIPSGFQTDCFAILPEADADEMQNSEHEAIVPTPMPDEHNQLLKVENALRAYFQVYELTGCENRASAAYYESFDNPTS